ncbi:hypothetical protein M832_07060 [Chlamydia avium 10DC88]|uniref:Uncharacterized protein n=1 Tax=Chlamydia avium 10DC88 TaxID=1229831 RepID=W8JMN3_9CHLA|nr:hypothetical protein M832_07060 [Chlamydia avium 10DC88]
MSLNSKYNCLGNNLTFHFIYLIPYSILMNKRNKSSAMTLAFPQTRDNFFRKEKQKKRI